MRPDLQDLGGALLLQNMTKVEDPRAMRTGDSRKHTLPLQNHLQGHCLSEQLQPIRGLEKATVTYSDSIFTP